MRSVTVIGGGPAGSKAAALLAEEHDVLVIEEHDVSGRPVQCTGLVSGEVITSSGVKPTVLSELYGAKIFFPNGKSIETRSKERKAVLIDRYELDTLMADKAKDAGAEYAYSERFLSHRTDGSVSVTTDRRVLETKMLIGADGQNSKLASSIENNGPAEYVNGMQYDIRHRADDQDMVNIHIGSAAAPGFFSWEIPFGDMTRVGLCVSPGHGTPAEYLKSMMKRTGLDGKRIDAAYCGRIPLGGRRRTYADNLLLIGDAAGQVKPISGGGLQPAFRSAYALAETVNEAFSKGRYDASFLSVYEKRWKRDTGKELGRGYRLRRMFTSMSDAELNKMADIAENRSIKDILSRGDIDHPSDLVLPIMMHPVAMLRLMPLIFKAMVR